MSKILSFLNRCFLKFNKKQRIDFKVAKGKIMSWPCGSIQHEFDVPPESECFGAHPFMDEGIVALFRLPSGDFKIFIYDPETNTSKEISFSEA